MNERFEQVGYQFGKALEALNADPLYYAWKLIDDKFSEDEERAVYAGCRRALAEVPPEVLAANLVKRVQYMMKMTDEQMASPWTDDEAQSFQNGLESALYADVPVFADLFQPVAAILWSDANTANIAAWERGREVGRQIMAAWNAALQNS
jgi:hypothetical protein